MFIYVFKMVLSHAIIIAVNILVDKIINSQLFISSLY